MFKTILENVRKTTPLVHNITNYVTVNDCANILIACGGAPIMADAVEEVKEITTICTALKKNVQASMKIVLFGLELPFLLQKL